jgi:hypothetical protein
MRHYVDMFANLVAAFARSIGRIGNFVQMRDRWTGVRPRRRPKFRMFGMVAALCLGCSSGPALAAESLEQTLLKLGFTQQDLKSVDALQAEPHYAPYYRWMQCLGTIGGLAVMNGHDGSTAGKFAIQMCVDDERELRASLARQFGNAKINQILTVAKAISVIAMQRHDRQQRR